jgi:hypothetical protein
MRETKKTSVRIASAPAKIRTDTYQIQVQSITFRPTCSVSFFVIELLMHVTYTLAQDQTVQQTRHYEVSRIMNGTIETNHSALS